MCCTVGSLSGLATNTTGGGADVDDRAQLQVGGRDRDAVDQQSAARPSRSAVTTSRPSSSTPTRPDGQIDPPLVVVAERDGGLAGDGIGGEHQQIGLVSVTAR